MTLTSNHDRAIAIAAAALLRQTRMIGTVSSALTAVGFAALLALSWLEPKTVALAVAAGVCVAGLVQLFLAVRVGFDAAIFAAFADNTEAGLQPGSFDRALQSLGLAGPADSGRDMAARAGGAMRLPRLQVAAVAVQALGLAVVSICLVS